MIDLYTWSTPNGRKVSIMLEETGLPYTVHPVNIGKGEQHSESYRAMNLNQKIPVIVDREKDITLAESAAILFYLADRSGRFYDPARHWETLEWMLFQVAHVGPMLGQIHHFVKYNPGKAPYAEERYFNEGLRIYGVLDQHLAEREYIVDDYSIVDIATFPWIGRFNWQGIDLANYPNLRSWYERIAVRPAVQRGWNVPPSDQPLPMPE